ncbi:MAG: hypothetical protein P1R58_01840 [bacterium]|nr:hypothetical protein [bacterium]
MSMTLAGYKFEGPIMTSGDLKTLPGVFAVITVWDTSPVLIDIDSGENTRESVKKHPRKRIWQKLSKPVGHAFVVRYQTTDDKKKREILVNDIRGTMDVPCGN